MGDREYKVVYKSRALEKDEERPRMPTALDPYDNPYSPDPPRRRDKSAKNSTTSLGENSSVTELARSTTRTSYPVREDERSRSAYVDTKRSSKFDAEPTPSESISVRRTVVGDSKRDDSPPRRSEAPSRRSEAPPQPRASRDRGYAEIDVGRPQGRGRDYYIDDRPRDYDAPYIIDARGAEIIDISYASRGGDRAYGRDPKSYVSDRDYDRKPHARPADESRGSTIVVGNREYQRSQYDDHRPSRAPTREYEREEDWKLIDSMRDTRIGSTAPTRDPPPSRSRAPTLASEDSYVMVSPTQASRPREKSRARSAVARSDYPDHELRRRRSRSISFRDSEVEQHEVGQRRHERPGAEADICGPYLRSSDKNFDDRSDVYSAFHGSDYRSRDTTVDAYGATYRLPQRDRERDGPYPPQQMDTKSRRGDTEVDRRSSKETEADRSPKRRDRSRKRDTEVDYTATKVSESDRGTSRRDRSRRRDTEVDYRSRRDETEVDYDAAPPKRERSRRRRRDEDEREDDASYYSEDVVKKTTTRDR